MKKKLILVLVLLALSFSVIFSQNVKKKTIDLDNANGKVKAGLDLGYPISGLTVGYRFVPSTEINFVLGTNYNNIALETSLLFNIIDFDVENQIFPFSVGPVLFTDLGPDETILSLGGFARVEYDFNFPLNLYFQLGCTVDIIGSTGRAPIHFPGALGIRYIF